MSKPQLAGEPSMDDILASIRKMISDDRPVAGSDHAPANKRAAMDVAQSAPETAFSLIPASLTAQPAAEERTPATFNSLADALKVAAAHSEQRRAGHQAPSRSDAGPQSNGAQLSQQSPLATTSQGLGASGQGAASSLGGPSATVQPGGATAGSSVPHRSEAQSPEFPDAWSTPAPAAIVAPAATLTPAAPTMARSPDRPDLLAFDFGTVVSSRDAGPLPRTPMPAVSTPPAGQMTPQPSIAVVEQPAAATAPSNGVADRAGAATIVDAVAAHSQPVAAAAPVKADVEIRQEPVAVAPAAVGPTPPIAAALKPTPHAGAVAAETGVPVRGNSQAREPLPEQLNGHGQPLPRPAFSKPAMKMNGSLAEPASPPASALPPLSNGQDARRAETMTSASALAVNAPEANAAPVPSDDHNASRAEPTATPKRVEPLGIVGHSNGPTGGGGVVAPFPRLLRDNAAKPSEVMPFEPPLTSRGARRAEHEADGSGSAGKPAAAAGVGLTSPALVDAPALQPLQRSSDSAIAATGADMAVADIGAAAQAKADALLDAVVDLVQQQPGALSVLTSGATFIGGIGEAKTSLPALTGASALAAPPQKLDRAAAELLRPMLRQWLAENMPRIVEEALRSELNEQLGGSDATRDNS